ncbi:hypothetical protein CYMTET_41736 [Cymbomonas tetramitiformis]|uniref:Uncharacterized protein n=1 Tax=Cymbomonas tetramitiformis TaxID=36881 RepID=A0AAE0F1Q0_9CHLO|nr:hypothetical protein CYMTET_41736 [Cymbomonas tetramitiformis]
MKDTAKHRLWHHLTTSYYFGILNLSIPIIFVSYVGVLTATVSKSKLSDPGFTIKVLFELTSHITSILGAFFLYNSLERVRASHEKRVFVNHTLALCTARTKALTYTRGVDERNDTEYARRAMCFLEAIRVHGSEPYDSSSHDASVEKLLRNLQDVWKEEIKQLERGESIYKYYTSDLKTLLHSMLYLQSFARSRVNSDVVPVLHLSAIMLGILIPFEIYDTDPETDTYNAMWQMAFMSYIVACIAQITVFCEVPRQIFTKADRLVSTLDDESLRTHRHACSVIEVGSM